MRSTIIFIGYLLITNVFSTAYGQCLADWVLNHPNNPGTTILGLDTLIRNSANSTNQTQVNVPELLPSGISLGWVETKLVGWGSPPPGKAFNPPTPYFDMAYLVNGNLYFFRILQTGSVYAYSPSGLVSTTNTSFLAGTTFRIQKNGTTLSLLKTPPTLPLTTTTIATISAVQVGDAQIFLRLFSAANSGMRFESSRRSFTCPSPLYSELKNQLDGSVFVLDDQQLRFKFEQQYDNNGTVPYRIYNSQHTVAQSGTFNSTFGTNWITQPVTSLQNNTIYILEFEANKGEKYYLRFKTKI